MRDFFDIDGPFVRYMGKLVDIVWLSLIFLVCSIPLFTIGASWSALYYVAHKNLRHNRGYATREFFKAFKDCFKQSTICFLFMAIIGGAISWEAWVMYQYAMAGQKIGRIYILFLIILAIIIMWALQLFPYISRFTNTTKNFLKNSIYFAISNLVDSVFLLIALILAILFELQWPFLVLILPALYMMLCDFFVEKIYKKYMTEADLAAEEDRERNFGI
ncbi:MAG: YesL family protein [Pseudobutyrivibrio sp.]|nr:YesL family protein [Pseudobutyrivibrio sp.]